MLSALNGLKVYKSVPFSIPVASVQGSVPFVFEPMQGKRVAIASLNVTGGNAADTVQWYAPANAGKTTVKTAIAASATTANLTGDTGANDTLNGHVVTTSDYVLVQLDARDRRFGWGGWQIFRIGTLGGATAGEIDINSIDTTADEDQFHEATTIRGAAAAGNRAYVIDSTEKASSAVGAATLNLELPFIGNPGAPGVLSSVGEAAAAHYFSGVAIYVD